MKDLLVGHVLLSDGPRKKNQWRARLTVRDLDDYPGILVFKGTGHGPQKVLTVPTPGDREGLAGTAQRLHKKNEESRPDSNRVGFHVSDFFYLKIRLLNIFIKQKIVARYKIKLKPAHHERKKNRLNLNWLSRNKRKEEMKNY